MMQDVDYISIPSHDPGVQIRIPMHRVFGAQAMIERIRIGENFRVQQMEEA
jgi:hypothetical protein